MNPVHQAFAAIIAYTKRTSFTMDVSDTRALGTALASFLDHSIDDVLDVAQEMFEEANMHSLNKKVDEWKLEKGL